MMQGLADGCRNDLKWESQSTNTNFRSGSSYTTYKCVKDPSLVYSKIIMVRSIIENHLTEILVQI